MDWQSLDRFADELLGYYREIVKEKHGRRTDIWPLIGSHTGCDLVRTTFGNSAVVMYRHRDRPGGNSRGLPELSPEIVGADRITSANREIARNNIARHFDIIGPRDAVLLFKMSDDDRSPDFTGELRYLLRKHEQVMPNVSMRATVFYSWQSDLPSNTNRSFIQRALELAVKAITKDDSIEVEPVIDRDTVGVPGSPDIPGTIFEKIDRADIFVADVSIVAQSVHDPKKKSPNPNVLVELGYAMKSLGPDRVVMVLNTFYGDPEQLPFDLSRRRAVSYRVTGDENEDRSNERKKLAAVLQTAISAIFQSPRSSAAAEENALQSIEAAIKGPIDAAHDLVETVYSVRLKGTYTGGKIWSPGDAEVGLAKSKIARAIRESQLSLASARQELAADKYAGVRNFIDAFNVTLPGLAELSTVVDSQLVKPEDLYELPLFREARDAAATLQKALVLAS